MNTERLAIHAEAKQALEKYGESNPQVALQIEALLCSLDDTLSDAFVLEELKAINATGRAFREVYAENQQNAEKRNEDHSRV